MTVATDGNQSGPWHGVELRHLAALRAVGRERSFRGAADRLGYVQSAVSQQISQFEKLVGMRLIDRASGHATVELTDAGRVLLAHADEVLARLSAARADLDSLAAGASATLRVGAVQCVAARVLPRALELLDNRSPEVRVEVTEAPSDEGFFCRLESGELDLAIAELPAPREVVESEELIVDPTVLVVPADSEFAELAEPVGLDEVAPLPLAGHPRWRLRELIDAEFGARGLEPRYELFAETAAATQALVASRGAAALMPRLAVIESDPAIEVLELDSGVPERTLALHGHRGRAPSPVVEAFREALVDAFADLVPERAATPAARRRARERAGIVA